MRLLQINNHGELSLTEYFLNQQTPYAILSHTWDQSGEEFTFRDLMEGTGKSKAGYRKIQFCAAQATRDGLKYFWVDTCCIDKSNSTELKEAMNSMFGWYRNAAQCYVYLSDVSSHGNGEDNFSLAERLSWAEKRSSTREEDQVYSLLGLFGVFMPIIYGEGRVNASRRLQQEIVNTRKTSQFDELVDDQQGNIKYIGRPEPVKISAPSAEGLEQKPYIGGLISGLAQPAEELSTNELLYSHPLGALGFRLFVVEPGLIGSPIIGHIREFNLLFPPPYYALSYVWGQEPAIHPVTINDKVKLIQPNLYHALQRIRLPIGKLQIWVDSLCINQLDDLERNVQVRQMAKIYSKSSSVLIWLGEADSSSKFALEFVSEIISNDSLWYKSWWEQYGFIALAQILERPWFRRGWVLQEAAFSANSAICCGDSQIHMDHFAMAVDLVRARLSTTIPLAFSRTANMFSTAVLTNFHDSPAVRLLDTIEGSFMKSPNGDILYHRLSLETLVDLSTFSETSDPRDTIYALLNLANDITSLSRPDQSDTIIPDYGKSVLDVFVDFVWHCCSRSGSLDVICRPWAPTLSSIADSRVKNNRTSNYIKELPSWIASRDKLPFGDPSRRLNYRLHGKPLVGGSFKRIYNAHYGSIRQVSVRRNDDGTCNGSLEARGFVIGEVAQRSTRLANAILTKECLQLLGTIVFRPHVNVTSVPDTIWRTVCADRDGKGGPAPRSYQLALLSLLQISSEIPETGDSINLLDHISSIDIEELLDTYISLDVREFLVVVRDVIWNRRTFRSTTNNPKSSPLVGLIPQNAKVGDRICILYGCSVPVVLRRHSDFNQEVYWQLIGDAYVHGIMDGEAIRDASPEILKSSQTVFEIR
ncbi:heterokaryon incompatibility -domain-containing protein [Rutstroemia sp. NJR-2017a BBW]|nr:heterokaryon incompatibility -domain-containing protein [Rutstroemia sp. NJR-2017a BBW]